MPWHPTSLRHEQPKYVRQAIAFHGKNIHYVRRFDMKMIDGNANTFLYFLKYIQHSKW